MAKRNKPGQSKNSTTSILISRENFYKPLIVNLSMKTLFIEARLKNLNVNLDKQEIAKLPKTLFLAYSVQYKNIIPLIKKQLENNKIKITKMQQVLGCSKVNTKDPILLIGQGRFHAINLYLQAPSIFVLENNKITKISEQEIEKVKNKRKAALLKFLHAENIGIIVSTKPGQENLAIALKIKQKLESKYNDKKFYMFLSNNIDLSQFENFNIQSWINTACPGLANDNSAIINYEELSW